MTTEEDYEPEGELVRPQRMVFADVLVIFCNFARNICDAYVAAFSDATMIFAAHANYRKRALEDKQAAATFRKQLSGLPTATR